LIYPIDPLRSGARQVSEAHWWCTLGVSLAMRFMHRSRHGTVYMFRRRVPADLRLTVGKTTLIKSLGTESRREALVRARHLASLSDKLFARLRGTTMSNCSTEEVRWGYTVSFEIPFPDGQKRAVSVAADLKRSGIMLPRRRWPRGAIRRHRPAIRPIVRESGPLSSSAPHSSDRLAP
jgi:hypothetical protein